MAEGDAFPPPGPEINHLFIALVVGLSTKPLRLLKYIDYSAKIDSVPAAGPPRPFTGDSVTGSGLRQQQNHDEHGKLTHTTSKTNAGR
ncbi:hypothetical protein ACGFS9_09420 [Streptomyces sp. NPDC048566]|uniref:hypothetical protein n=1 Tax=Streptomyces sp. NPDC048566 TaxID=3365569 RepID=UPI0037141A57